MSERVERGVDAISSEGVMKIWTEGVSKAEIETEISAFFKVLRRGDLKLARSSVAHRWDDWEHQIWSLWQET